MSPHPSAPELKGRELEEWKYWTANPGKTAARLLDLAEFLDEFGIGMGDHSDRPLLAAAASMMDRLDTFVAMSRATTTTGATS